MGGRGDGDARARSRRAASTPSAVSTRPAGSTAPSTPPSRSRRDRRGEFKERRAFCLAGLRLARQLSQVPGGATVGTESGRSGSRYVLGLPPTPAPRALVAYPVDGATAVRNVAQDRLRRRAAVVNHQKLGLRDTGEGAEGTATPSATLPGRADGSRRRDPHGSTPPENHGETRAAAPRRPAKRPAPGRRSLLPPLARPGSPTCLVTRWPSGTMPKLR